MENIIIVYGGKSCESDISVITALSVYRAVRKNFIVQLVYLKNGKFFIGKKLSDLKRYKPFREKNYKEVYFGQGKMYQKGFFRHSKKIDCAIVCCHGGEGENGSVSGLFEIADIPYTCCGPLQSAVCMDKVFTKYLLQYFHFPTLPFKKWKKGDSTDDLPFSYPVIVKPSSLGSSIGISIAKNEEELSSCIENASRFDEKLLIESALENCREFTCAAIKVGEDVLCSQIEEVIAPDHFYSFTEKYRGGETQRIYPAQIAPQIKSRIIRTCKKIYVLFELKGVVRIDFLESEGKIYVNEINTIPGSLSWYLYKDMGYDLGILCQKLIEEAKKGYEEKLTLFTDFDSDVLRFFPADGKGSGGKIES